MNASAGPGDRAGSQPHASAEELAAFVLDPHMLAVDRRAHIESCAVCAPEAAWLGAEISGLEHEALCPSVEALTRFALGESSSGEQLRIAAHLRDCAACSDEIALTRAAFQTPAPGDGFAGAIRRMVASLAPALQPGVRTKRDAGVSAQSPSMYVYAAGDLEVRLRIDADDDVFTISGVLRAPTPPVQVTGVESVALLYPLSDETAPTASPLVAHAPVTASSDFDLPAVRAGTYRLEIVRGDTEIIVSPLIVP